MMDFIYPVLYCTFLDFILCICNFVSSSSNVAIEIIKLIYLLTYLRKTTGVTCSRSKRGSSRRDNGRLGESLHQAERVVQLAG